MMRCLRITGALILTAALWLSYTAALKTEERQARRVCYYESWSVYRPEEVVYTIDDIPGDLCTHLTYSFCGLSNETWEIISLDPELDINGGGYERFVALKEKFPGLKTTASVGGWAEGGAKYSQMVSLKERRDIFVKSAVQLLTDYGFDGLDVDWEYPGAAYRGGAPEDKENFKLLLEELRAAFDAEGKGWDLSIAVPLDKNLLDDGYSVPELCRTVDAVNVMAYDLRSYFDGFTDIHSVLYRRPNLDFGAYKNLNVNNGSLLWVDMGCPRDKLVVGTPFYGHTYTLVNPDHNDLHAFVSGGGKPGPYSGSSGSLTYLEICTMLTQEDGWDLRYDDVGLVPFTVKGDQWVGYEDPHSLKIKMDYIRDMGFLGAMTWAIDLDDFLNQCGEGVNPMMTTIYEGMKDYIVPEPAA